MLPFGCEPSPVAPPSTTPTLMSQKVPRWFQASWNSDARTAASAAIPSHMWCLLVQYCDVRDFGRILGCSVCLLSPVEKDALWHYHAFASGFAEPVVRTSFNWIYPFMPEIMVEKCIDWQRYLKMNSQRRKSHGVTVRVRDVDLRMPLPSKSSVDELLFDLTQLACHAKSPIRYCLRHNKQESGLRLRLLQWAGRPGPVQYGSLTNGEHLLLEWSLQFNRGWPLPTHVGAPVQTRVTERQHSSPFPSSSFFAALRRNISESDTPVATAAASSLPSSSNQSLVLVRIVSSLLESEVWLPLDLSTETLAGLYEAIAKSLRSEYCRRELKGDVNFQMMDTLNTDKKQTWESTCLLRDLCWTHCETLTVELDQKKSSYDTAGQKLLIWREPEIAQVGGPQIDVSHQKASRAETHVSEQNAHAHGNFGLSLPSRQAQDTTISTQRTSAQSEDIDQKSSSFTRKQGPSRQVTLEWEADQSSPRRQISLSLTSRQSSPARRQVSFASQSNYLPCHPGDRPLEGECENGSANAWERVAPHYSPKVLMNTHQARQFEFHPSLPEVMLIGDKVGGVNVIDMDQSTMHQPLVVDSCPFLGLSWFRHHPQRAVCGASRSGQIRFLKYDPQAAPNATALEQVSVLEEFPKLSSLSVNCTDDLLLASGFSHDLALYDANTGKVLHRVVGAHTHFINISRFAQRSPHVFATASFDHTCKVWDARQPLLQDKPAKILHTGFFNVMCTFSPDDRYLLCSGIDTNITQFELPTFSTSPASFQMRPAVHHSRYRRSMYLPTGRHFVTAATDESHIRIMSSTGRNLGVVDFCGLLGHGKKNRCRPTMPSQPTSSRWPWRADNSDGNGSLIHGEVRLDEESNATTVEQRRQKEYVQSVRSHPIVQNRLGVLLSSYVPDQSYITIVDLDPKFTKWE